MTRKNELIDTAIAFISEIKDKTPGEEMEHWLNASHGQPSL